MIQSSERVVAHSQRQRYSCLAIRLGRHAGAEIRVRMRGTSFPELARACPRFPEPRRRELGQIRSDPNPGSVALTSERLLLLFPTRPHYSGEGVRHSLDKGERASVLRLLRLLFMCHESGL